MGETVSTLTPALNSSVRIEMSDERTSSDAGALALRETLEASGLVPHHGAATRTGMESGASARSGTEGDRADRGPCLAITHLLGCRGVPMVARADGGARPASPGPIRRRPGPGSITVAVLLQRDLWTHRLINTLTHKRSAIKRPITIQAVQPVGFGQLERLIPKRSKPIGSGCGQSRDGERTLVNTTGSCGSSLGLVLGCWL